MVECLLERFMYLIPLWSGMMLSISSDGMTRNTNSVVEGWFKVVKHNCLKSKGNRPSKFAIYLRKLIYGRLMELDFPGARLPKTKTTRKRKLATAHDINLTEEKWSRNKHKKAKYQPARQKTDKTKDMQNVNLPTVSGWRGHSEGQVLQNTCTIDNGLTILHLKITENINVQQKLDQNKSRLFSTLLSVFALMSEECFASAKLIWVNFTEKTTPAGAIRDLYGDESDFFFSFFDPEWRSRVNSTCDDMSCPQRYKESGEIQGVTLRYLIIVAINKNVSKQ